MGSVGGGQMSGGSGFDERSILEPTQNSIHAHPTRPELKTPISTKLASARQRRHRGSPSSHPRLNRIRRGEIVLVHGAKRGVPRMGPQMVPRGVLGGSEGKFQHPLAITVI